MRAALTSVTLLTMLALPACAIAQPRWIAPDGRPTPQAHAAVAVLRDVAARGLKPEDYDAAPLGRQLAALDATRDSLAGAAFDDALSRAMRRLLTHLHMGRIDPRTLGFHLPQSHDELDLDALLVAVSRASDVAHAVAEAEPKYAGYRALVSLLARYRALDGDSALRRVRQIALTLERWRWLPDVPPPRYLVVNIPAFRLYAFANDPTAANPALRMDVIVGQATDARRTPVFAGAMREVVFRPYWDVPPTIASRELLPRLRRDPAYASRDGLELVRGDDDGSAAHTFAPTRANLDRVRDGTLRIRQRPGARNALGPVKFVFPNSFNVYLHGTPATELFARTRRDFSHGCVRVSDPPALAGFVLDGQPEWDAHAIADAMSAKGAWSRRVQVAQPLAVYVLYATVVQGDDGVVHFYRDVYGHDAALAKALGVR